jgi:uncharacterized protein YabN with tetrapyrrole methylase and pyrophosphatase domain
MNRIRVVGLGVQGIEQLTLAGLRQLREAEAVLHLVDPAVDVRELTDRPTESLHALHRAGARDHDPFGRLLARILERARADGDIAVLLPGDPRLGVTVVQQLQRLSEAGELALHVEPGISTFTTTVNNLGIDPLERGTLVVDANRLLLFQQLPNPSFNTFVYHVGGADRAELLQRLLLRAYDAEHPACLVEQGRAAAGTAAVAWGRVGSLAELLANVFFAGPLYLPAAVPRRVDRAVLALLTPFQPEPAEPATR